ncbi:hypothetical protein [Rhodonellum sp.]|uniref:glycoside hydrolase family 130 protein n=1 Tax=Rhodonellum sp. TaxID=2231180 RepID=UPI00271AD258|nr:hypothetical protein [Rhodonellum sp.]MDO9554201.1 hypothetical protein [Rhodonellum sp.]
MGNSLFWTAHDWEKMGLVNSLVFLTGAILKDESLYIYYGAAHNRIGTVSLDLKELITEIKSNSHERKLQYR